MTISRRNFIQLGAATSALAGFAAPHTFAAGIFEPSRVDQNDGVILLYSNENAYGPSKVVANAIMSAVASSNRYPRMQYPALTEKIAATHQAKPEQILLGCGSTEILRMAACAFLGNGKRLIQASPTFEAMGAYARIVGAEVSSVPLTSTFAHDLNGMLAQAGASAGLVYICNPNNPTASLTPRKDIEDFVSKLPASALVVIDEAYHHFAGNSAMYASFIDRPINDERVIVMRTFSKVYGLAGLRLGYAVAAPAAIKRMAEYTTHDNINAFATYASFAALDDTKGVSDAVHRNSNDRQEFFNQAMGRSLKPIDSHTNFVMMNTFHPAEDAIAHFRANNILIGRRFPAMETYIRVSLGLPEEMLAFWKTWDMLPYAGQLRHH